MRKIDKERAVQDFKEECAESGLVRVVFVMRGGGNAYVEMFAAKANMVIVEWHSGHWIGEKVSLWKSGDGMMCVDFKEVAAIYCLQADERESWE